MKLRSLSFVCLSLLLVASTASAETERFQRTVALAPGGTVKLHNFSGRVNITATDQAQVVVNATRTASRDVLDRIKLDVSSSGSVVQIEANKKVSSSWLDHFGRNNVVETDMEIQVPRNTNLEIDVFSSPVVVTNVEGNHKLHSFSADLRMTGVTGPVTAETFNAEIDLELAASATSPDLDLHTFSGDIDVHLPSHVQGAVDFNSFSGDLTSDYALTFRSKHGHQLRADLPGGGDHGSISMKTFSGDARISRL
jgi:hypothetical protein